MPPTETVVSVSEAAKKLGLTQQAILARIWNGQHKATKVGNRWRVTLTADDLANQPRPRALQVTAPSRALLRDERGTAALGTRVRELRYAAGVGSRVLARRLARSENWLSDLETGRAGKPSDEIVLAIAAELGADSDELFRLIGRIPPDLRTRLVDDPAAVGIARAALGCADRKTASQGQR